MESLCLSIGDILSMSTNLIVPKLTALTHSLDAYIARIRKIPVLSAQAEQTLTEAFFYQKDLSAAKQLVVSNLRFVVYIAQSYAGYGLAMGDLIQEGNVGLMKAVKRFDPRMKVRLISFAVHWIKAEIQEFILRNWRIVKVATTKAKRKLFFNLRKIRKRLSWSTQQEVEAIARDLGVKATTVREMEGHLSSQDISLESHLEDNQDHQHSDSRLPVVAFSDARYDPASLLEASNFAEQGSHGLQQALTSLDDRSRDIINKRWLIESKVTLKKLAKHYQVSMERIRQLEQSAIQQLRRKLEEYA